MRWQILLLDQALSIDNSPSIPRSLLSERKATASGTVFSGMF